MPFYSGGFGRTQIASCGMLQYGNSLAELNEDCFPHPTRFSINGDIADASGYVTYDEVVKAFASQI